MGVHVTDVGLRDTGILDSAVHGLHQAERVFARGGNVVCIARDARTKHFAVLLGSTLLRMFVRFHNHDTSTFAKRNAIATVKRRASVFVEGMERKESGIRDRSKRIGAARNHDIGLTGANQVASDRNRNCTSSTSIRYVSDNATGPASFSHLRRNRCNRHLCDFRSVATMLMILFNRKNAAHATSDNHAHTLVVIKVFESGIG